MSDPTSQPRRRIQRQIDTLGHGLTRLLEAVEVLKRRVARETIGDEHLRAWLKPWLAVASCEPPVTANEPAQLTWDDESWRMLSPSGPELSVSWATVLMLLHLPSLRTFWRQSMRASRLRRLQTVLPKAWALDPTIVPPGAVIAGLGITNWDQLPSKVTQGRTFQAVAVNDGTRLNIDDASRSDWQNLPGLTLIIDISPVAEEANRLEAQWTRADNGRIVLKGS